MRAEIALLTAVIVCSLLTLMLLDVCSPERVSTVYGLMLSLYALDNWSLSKELERRLVHAVDVQDELDHVLMHSLLFKNMTLQKTVKDLETELQRHIRSERHTETPPATPPQHPHLPKRRTPPQKASPFQGTVEPLLRSAGSAAL